MAALALPPFHVYPALVTFGIWLWLLHRCRRFRDVARVGLAFGYGWYLASLHWVTIAFYTDVERFGALAVPAVLLLALGNALFVMAAALLAAWRSWRSPFAHAAALTVAWSSVEYLRGSIGIGFPWNPLSIVWAPLPELLQPAAFVGSRGLASLTLLAALLWFSVLIGKGAKRWLGPTLSIGIVVACWSVGTYRLQTVQPPAGAGPEIRIVQANIAQHHKWDPDKRLEWFERHLELSSIERATPARIIVWPESAVPYQLEREPQVREAVGSVAPDGGMVLVGGDRFELDAEPPVANNSVYAIDRHGSIRGRYDKVNLVPFGEFLPARSLLATIGLQKLTQGTIDFVSGPGRQTLVVEGVPPFSPLICYEAIFPGGAVATEARPAWLLNITNDAWFGLSAGPYQHLAMARLRAVEEGLPLVRAANTGISAVIDPFGRDIRRLELGQAGVIDERLPAALDRPTTFRTATPWVELFLLIVVGLTGIFAETRGMKTRPARVVERG